jgi:hypothetical protein
MDFLFLEMMDHMAGGVNRTDREADNFTTFEMMTLKRDSVGGRLVNDTLEDNMWKAHIMKGGFVTSTVTMLVTVLLYLGIPTLRRGLFNLVQINYFIAVFME